MMMQLTCKHLIRAGLPLAACLWLCACGSLNAGRNAPPFRDAAMSMQHAFDTIVVGGTTQAEALTALGPATEIKFDSGYAVWVYRARASEPDADRAEFVILFAPSGVVKKTRLRPAYADRCVRCRTDVGCQAGEDCNIR
jgi:hypothetical protein